MTADIGALLWFNIKALTRIKLRCVNKYAVYTNIGYREMLKLHL